jgi:hypothetical protein
LDSSNHLEAISHLKFSKKHKINVVKFIVVDMEGPIAATIGTANIFMAVSDGKERTKVFSQGRTNRL